MTGEENSPVSKVIGQSIPKVIGQSIKRILDKINNQPRLETQIAIQCLATALRLLLLAEIYFARLKFDELRDDDLSTLNDELMVARKECDFLAYFSSEAEILQNFLNSIGCGQDYISVTPQKSYAHLNGQSFYSEKS